ncbi:MAG: hypothetical protein CUN53_02445 [Phototrophicales bacterium]|nr:MAG: hypothetical protein CUN53_02445 [Phototrophicales bacterium]
MTDAAKQIGRDPSTVRYWIKRGFITSYILGKTVILVNMREVERFSENNPPIKRWAIDKKKKKA